MVLLTHNHLIGGGLQVQSIDVFATTIYNCSHRYYSVFNLLRATWCSCS